MAPNAAQSGKREVSCGSLDHCAWARSRAALNAALVVQIAMALRAAQSAIAAPSRMAPNAAQLGKREVSDGSLDHCAWARSRAALSAVLWCRLQWRYARRSVRKRVDLRC